MLTVRGDEGQEAVLPQETSMWLGPIPQAASPGARITQGQGLATVGWGEQRGKLAKGTLAVQVRRAYLML